MTEQEYRKYPAVSQSMLGWLDQHPKYYYFKTRTKTPSSEDHFRMGSAVDCLLTSPKEFKDRFIQITDFVPTGKMKALCDAYLKYLGKNLSKKDAFLHAYQDADYSIGIDAVEKTFHTPNVERYLKEKEAAEGKIVLSKEEMDTVKAVVRSLSFGDSTKQYFGQKSTKKKEFLYQFPILFKIGDKECKGLLDLLIIDHERKVVEPIDVKTTGKSVYEFPKSFIQFRYYLQAAYYTEAVRYFLRTSAITLGQDLSDYRIENFKFIVAEMSNYNAPYVFQCTNNDLHVGEHGGSHKDYSRQFKGYRQLLSELEWHETNNYWDMPKESFEEKFFKQLDVFKKEVD
jgi:hypothetical protein